MNYQKLKYLIPFGIFLIGPQIIFKVDVGETGIIFNYLIGFKKTNFKEGYHLKLPFIEK